jgi:hypothetical protein
LSVHLHIDKLLPEAEVRCRQPYEGLRISYPLPVRSEEAVIGNPGFKSFRYRVTWKGDTVVRMDPLGNEDKTGWSDFDEREVPIFYGKEGPGPLYQREPMLAAAVPEPAPLQEDDGLIDFWHLK